MNKRLENLISKKTAQENFEKVLKSIDKMICSESEVALSEDTLYEALEGDGEFFLLKARYEDFDLGAENPLLDRKLKEALMITICFEDDGSKYKEIEAFVKYIYENTTGDQKFRFGIRCVEKLGDYPIKILLSEIYPINQLDIHLGSWIYDFIRSDREYFKKHFAMVRAKISQEIGIALLPLNIINDENLCENDAMLLDSVTKERIVAFNIHKSEDKKALDIYLLKLYYVFIKLGGKYKH